MSKFELKAPYSPAWDQPDAIKKICNSFDAGKNIITLVWATWTGKTFTMANTIQHIQKPTLIISHNKTLAAQLATEFKHFFPNNAVHYFVSYFDYYQPESFLPEQGLYIEKEATINKEIEMYRLATMASLLSRDDVIVVASVSSLYWLWHKRFFEENCLQIEVAKQYDFNELKAQLLKMQYEPVQSKIEHGMFDFKWDHLDIFSSTEKYMYRVHFNDETVDMIELRDSQTYEYKGKLNKISLWPATQFLQDMEDVNDVLEQIEAEMKDRIKYFEKKKMFAEAERIKKRVTYDISMIRETWFTNGIENYSPYFNKSLPGEPPNTLFDYFPDDFLLIVDESHMTIPQFQAMPKADRARKKNLIDFWFRLPSAIDHRPLRFEELEVTLWWKDIKDIDADAGGLDSKEDNIRWELSLAQKYARQSNQLAILAQKHKKKSNTLFASATPAEFELQLADIISEQIIRPTGLLDPITYVYPKSGDCKLLEDSISELIKKKPYLEHFFKWYKHKKEDFEEIFGA